MRRFLWLILALLLPIEAASAIGEQYGRITGVIYDPDGAELAYAKITLSSPTWSAGPQTQVSAPDGSFVFDKLPPGKYELTVEKDRLQTYKKTNINVSVGKTASLFIAMEFAKALPPTKPSQPLLDNGSHPFKDPTVATTFPGLVNLPGDVPVGRVYQDTNEGNPNVHGGTFRNNRYLVDGMEPVTFTPCCNCCSEDCWVDPSPSATWPFIEDTKSEALQKLPKEGQSLESYVLELPRTEVKANLLLMNGKPANLVINGQSIAPMTKQSR
jgi:hypothetical protein